MKVYISNTCPMVPPTLALLDGQGVQYTILNIDEDSTARKRLRELARGNLSVPTLELEDGNIYIEPNLFKLRSIARDYKPAASAGD